MGTVDLNPSILISYRQSAQKVANYFGFFELLDNRAVGGYVTVMTMFLMISREMERVGEILDEAISATSVPVIKEVASHIIGSGGKRFRPALAVLSAKIAGNGSEKAPYLGAAIELVHTASIIHDDVLDNAELRRGVATANSRWGNHLSVLVGDYCFCLASSLLVRHTNNRVVEVVTRATEKTTEGEVLEIVGTNNINTSIDTYLNVVYLKTACLIEASCEAGALMAEATPKIADALKNYGKNLGIAFQITDDVLDYTSESYESGKNRGTDLKEGKLTLPLIYALEVATAEERALIKDSLLSSNVSNKDFISIIELLHRYGAITKAKGKALEYINAAKDALSIFRTSLEKEALLKFADHIVQRNS